jgi:hypothetical protein
MTAIRRPGATSVAVLFVLGASLVTAQVLAPEWVRGAGLDVWNLPSAEADLRTAVEERNAVNSAEERRARCREAANQIAAQLAAGAIPLPAAADQIAEMFRGDNGPNVAIRAAYPTAPTDRHRFARHAIDRVKRVLSDEPDRCAAAVAVLECEYVALGAPSDVRHGQ